MVANRDEQRTLLDGFEDPRDPRRRYVDRKRVAQQVEAIRWNADNEAYRRSLLRLAQERRAQRRQDWDDQPVLDFDVLHSAAGGRDPRDERGPRDLVLATAELLVRSEDARSALAGLGGAYRAEPVGDLDDRVTRLVPAQVGAGRDLARVAEDAAALRAQGVMATVTHVVPLGGYVAKGRGGAEPTDLARPYPAPEVRTESAGVRVAVVDTGITAEVRDDGWLARVGRGDPPGRDPAVIDPLHWFSGDGKTLDLAAGHGTLAAGIVQQVAPDAEIVMYRAIDSDGIGSELRIALALVRAVREGAQVVNLSLGTQTEGDHPPVGLEVALELAAEIAPDVLVVAAAGNSASSRPTWPAAFPGVVAVAGLTSDLQPGTWSNHGHWVDCSTVGEGVVSTYVEGVELPQVDDPPDEFDAGAWAVVTGTSFAAPQVAGAVARLLAERPDGEKLTPRDALRLLLAPDRGQPEYYGARRLPDFGWAVPLLPGT